mmetsp:Transcript_42933/g.43535  ORF Transcript_42933/g.43535 Transcript_42933/m.43535 type:complete len:83 (-) Transcript_42933:181-429(-)
MTYTLNGILKQKRTFPVRTLSLPLKLYLTLIGETTNIYERVWQFMCATEDTRIFFSWEMVGLLSEKKSMFMHVSSLCFILIS